MSSPESRPAVPLEYEPESPRKRPIALALMLIAVGLAIAVVGGFVFLMLGRAQLSATIIAAQPATPSIIPAPGKEQMASTLLPPEGMQITLKQRESRWLAGGRLKLSIDDITNGQALISLSDDAQNVLLGPKSVREGDKLEFSDPNGAPVLLEVIKFTNLLIGDDFADFRLMPAPATRPALSEPQKVEMLLARVGAAEGVVFIRNGSEHSPQEAAEHLRSKWETAGGPENPQATARDFIEQVGSRSSMSGQEYRIRLPDGSAMPSARWLRQQLDDIEHGGPTPSTQPSRGDPAVTNGLLFVSLEEPVDPEHKPMNLVLPTLGGKQLWTDLRIDPSGWRIQHHALTGHCRLLDPRNVRRAWGSYEECARAWSGCAPPDDQTSRAGRELVVILHGLGRSRSAMQPMATFLRGAGYDVIDFGYASTRAGLDQHAEALGRVLGHLGGYKTVHFVGHSLGALVVRRYLATPPGGSGAPIGRVVMYAPPNNGSFLATRLQRNPVFLAALGPAAHELAHWQELAPRLATPHDCGVIAGHYRLIANPLLDGEGDLVVTVEETKLAGMKDFASIDATHTFMMRIPEVMQMTLSFLRAGRFGPADPVTE